MSDVELFSGATAMESMRSSDFDVYSAMGEVIDNSIQANAQSVKIQIQYESLGSGRKKEPIQFVAFGDDGDGMHTSVLHRCLQVGYSSRFNDRTGIGRFGVGAILGAINQCKRVEIYSKQADGDWNYTYIDLEEVSSQEMTSIPEPVKRMPPPDLKVLTNESKGTLVVWKKYDKQPTDASEIIRELAIWMGRTYRKFIWGEVQGVPSSVSFYVNGEEVRAIDPLYAKTEKTRFIDDPKAEKYETMELSWTIPEGDRILGDLVESTILIDVSLLPGEWRPNQGAANRQSNLDRFVHQNNGISILRNGREVFYGPIPHWPGDRFQEIDRWWGCEVSFDAVLDKEFTVKNIKRGALPVKELKKAIQEKIKPTRKTCLEEVRNLWEKTRREAERTDGELDTGHSKVEKAVKKVPTPESVIDKEKDIDKETKEYSEKYLTECTDRERAQWIAKFKSQPFTIKDESWRGGDFMEVKHLGGNSVLSYNTRHRFFKEISQIRQELREETIDNPIANKLGELIDLLLISYAKAETMVNSEYEATMDFLKSNWGHFLSSYIESYKKEQEEQN